MKTLKRRQSERPIHSGSTQHRLTCQVTRLSGLRKMMQASLPAGSTASARREAVGVPAAV